MLISLRSSSRHYIRNTAVADHLLRLLLTINLYYWLMLVACIMKDLLLWLLELGCDPVKILLTRVYNDNASLLRGLRLNIIKGQ